MIEGPGSKHLTNGSGSGSRRPKNIRIRIRIRNTSRKWYLRATWALSFTSDLWNQMCAAARDRLHTHARGAESFSLRYTTWPEISERWNYNTAFETNEVKQNFYSSTLYFSMKHFLLKKIVRLLVSYRNDCAFDLLKLLRSWNRYGRVPYTRIYEYSSKKST